MKHPVTTMNQILQQVGIRPKIIPPLDQHPLRNRKRGKHMKGLFYAIGYGMSLERAYKLKGVSRRQVRVLYKQMLEWSLKFY